MNFWGKLALGGVLAVGGVVVGAVGTKCMKEGAEGLIDFAVDTVGKLGASAADNVPKLAESAADSIQAATEAVADATT